MKPQISVVTSNDNVFTNGKLGMVCHYFLSAITQWIEANKFTGLVFHVWLVAQNMNTVCDFFGTNSVKCISTNFL